MKRNDMWGPGVRVQPLSYLRAPSSNAVDSWSCGLVPPVVIIVGLGLAGARELLHPSVRNADFIAELDDLQQQVRPVILSQIL